ncbi:Dehydrogenase with different specificities [Indibacter alkaliphilus LW1]|jgi:NAD(P)-dependent dehydrogenase (short-subunit alcohol dehydrogenase family)|uniref:Dehydrogenase with different specificities n=1 Tax=Indibacter alkaliphilus (strain CCUG 57479 / KCTC 22604 / LW1) TaxID=1189612 RepID=S2DK73_INDAL|nr:SDR family NAD(P)-dependent oxidoreductase [Indibacter alkaliphilus]EOZ92396.1 Dehydrogenase with different specificities [Indibacter alkaliphilus LW1]
MERNIIVTGAAGNLGQAVVEKFKREGYRVIATILPDSEEEVEGVEAVYEVDVTDEKSVVEFAKEYQLQYGEVDAIGLLVGGFAMGTIEETSLDQIHKMINLNFYSAYNMVKSFLPMLKKANSGCFLFVGARPALQPSDGQGVVAYALSKRMVIELADYVAEEAKDSHVRSHVFVPSIIDTPENREAMPDANFADWVAPSEIAEAMHYAVNNPALRNMTFKLYGGV